MTAQAGLTIKHMITGRLTTTTPSTTAGIDLRGYVNPGGRQMKVATKLANVAGTTPSVTIKIQDSSDDSTYNDVTGAAYSAATTNGDLGELHFRTSNRYVRAIATFTSNTTQADIACVLLVENRIV